MKIEIRKEFSIAVYFRFSIVQNIWFVYIVRCNDGILYTGVTNDLQKRVDTHNDGSGSRYIRSRRPVKLVYKEQFSTKSEALKREAEIKDFSRESKKRLVKFGARK